MNDRTPVLGAAVVAAFAAGWLFNAGVPRADAQQPAAGEHAEPAPPPRVLCRLFTVRTEAGWTVDTSDRTTEIGQWLGEMEESGWVLQGMDFEIGQKPTGYPQAWVQVCAER